VQSQTAQTPIFTSLESIEDHKVEDRPPEILEKDQALEYESTSERSSTSSESIVLTRHSLKKNYFKGAHGVMISAPGLSLS
jgi:hypothetical protein